MATLRTEGPSGPWTLESSYEEKSIPKAAGLWWHPGLRSCDRGPGRCKACEAGIDRTWWTADRAIAVRLIEYADAPARASLEETAQAVAGSRATDAAIDLPAPEGRTYMPFQRAGIAYALARPRTIIGDEMGLGKTIQALGVINADPSIKRVLVLCPATLRLNWAREAERWLVEPRPAVIVADDAPEIPAGPTLVIANYERARRPKCFQALRAAGPWDLVVADEAHRLKDPKTQQTKAVLGAEARKKGGEATPGLIDGARRALLLTGTPLVNRPIELWPLARACAPDTFTSFWGFAKRYAAAHQNGFGWDLTGASHLDELQDKLRANCMVRRLKRDVLTELPAKTRQVIEIPPNGLSKIVEAEESAWASAESDLEELQEAVDAAHALGDKVAYEAAVNALRQGARVAFEQISRVRHATAVAKIPKVVEHVLEVLEGESKVIVMGHHHDVLDGIREGLEAAGIAVTGIDGRTAQDDRQAICDAFQAEGGPRVFVGSITAAGVGITLTRARTVIFAELDWVPGNVTQAEDRAHRIGQTEPVLIQHIVLDRSLDARMAKVLVKKQGIADKALDTIREQIKAEPVIPRRTQARPTEYLVATDLERAAAAAAMGTLAGMCDQARELDGFGFSKIDVRLGHSLAGASGPYTDGQTWLAMRLARKYRRQLCADLNETVEAYHARGKAE